MATISQKYIIEIEQISNGWIVSVVEKNGTYTQKEFCKTKEELHKFFEKIILDLIQDIK